MKNVYILKENGEIDIFDCVVHISGEPHDCDSIYITYQETHTITTWHRNETRIKQLSKHYAKKDIVDMIVVERPLGGKRKGTDDVPTWWLDHQNEVQIEKLRQERDTLLERRTNAQIEIQNINNRLFELEKHYKQLKGDK